MIGVACVAFCQMPFEKTLEEVSREFRLWEILSEGTDQLELVQDGILHGRDSYNMRYQVHAPLSDVNIGSVFEPMRSAALSEIEKTISLCHKLEIPLITVHPGFVNGIAFLDRRTALEKTRQSVQALVAISKKYSVEMVVENLPANMNATCSTASELLEVLDGIDVRICFDMGHANTAGQLDDFLKLVDRFGNVHLHNNHGQWDQHNVIDDGSADLGRVIAALKRAYSGNIIIEATDLSSGVASRAILEKLLA